ncbi:MAG: pyridoxamine 5'-phosphate oxidase family protein [Burkholderiaceae bacterium]
MTAPLSTGPFHEGECAMQDRAGARQRLAELGSRVIRSFMPEQHREFFAQLPFVIAGTVDARGQPWASVLANPPGFIGSPEPEQLLVRAQPLVQDPLAQTLAKGAPIGLLGIEPHTRRRNRMNGIVERSDGHGFAVRVSQSFGNCPKYIQARRPEYLTREAPGAVQRGAQLDAAGRQMIRRADTFFIATAHPAAHSSTAATHGVDVSHRGGKPGFVRVDGDTLTVPDFLGNFFFNTLGNIAVHPRAGLLFIDFDTGDLLYLAARAAIVWDGPEVQAFEGAERLLRFQLESVLRVEAALPLRWGQAELSPQLERTGAWN